MAEAAKKTRPLLGGKELDITRLKSATLTLNYLKSNSATHKSPFSALAELVDNAHDAYASNLSVDFLEMGGQQMLEVIDDGSGMTPREMNAIYAFGHSKKTTKSDRVGRYGNGLKSGGFYLGRELFVISKNANTRTVLLISHRFHEDFDLRETVFVPCISYQRREAHEPIPEMMPMGENEIWKRLEGSDKVEFEQDLDIINRYAPTCGMSLDYWFDKIPNNTGTLLLIAGLQRTALGELSFAVTDDDLILSKDDEMPWKSSLRYYLSILYLDPSTKITLRGKKVEPKKVSGQWMFRRRTTFKGSDFNEAYKAELAEQKQGVDAAYDDFKNEQSRLGEMHMGEMSVDRQSRIEQNLLRRSVTAKHEFYLQQNKEYEERAKEKRLNYTFNVYMGLNVMDRNAGGINLYINNRLITPQRRNIPFYKKKNTSGVSMYIALNYTFFLPTHDKQGFVSTKDSNALLRKCNEQLERYFYFLNLDGIPRHLYTKWKMAEGYDMEIDDMWDEFWKKMEYRNPRSLRCVQGALTPELKMLYGVEPAFWKACNACMQWRKFDDPEIDPNFVCSDLPLNSKGCKFLRHFERFEELCPPQPRPRELRVPQSPPPSPSNSSDLDQDRTDKRVKNEQNSTTRSVRSQGPSLQSEHSDPPEIVLDELADRIDEEGTSSSTRAPRRRGSRSPPRATKSAVAKRGAVVKSRRRRVEIDSEEEEEEVVERAPAKKARGRPAAQPMNREKWLEEKVNQFLLATGNSAIPKNRQTEFDPTEILKTRDKIKNRNLKSRLNRNEAVLEKLIKYAKTLKGFNLEIPEYTKLDSVLPSIEAKLDELIKKTK